MNKSTGTSRPTNLATAAVIDTNAFEQGRVTASAIKSIGKLHAAGVTVIVPEVVCRELASHEWHKAREVRDFLDVLGQNVPAFNDPNSVYESIKNKLAEVGVIVLNSSARHYREAVHAQILREAPASPKKDITTGAVDYLVYLHAIETRKKYDTVAVITNDSVLKTSLSLLPGVSVFPNLGGFKGSGINTMRLSGRDAVAAIRDLLSEVFRLKLATELGATPGSMEVIGVGDIFKINALDLSAYVDLRRPVFINDLNASADYGDSVDRYQVTFNSEDLTISSWGIISTDPFLEWPYHLTPIDEFIATELSMVPSVIRPELVDFELKLWANYTYETSDPGTYVFKFQDEEFARINWHKFSVTHEYSHEGEAISDVTVHWEITAPGSNNPRRGLKKGHLAGQVMRHSIDNLKAEEEDRAASV